MKTWSWMIGLVALGVLLGSAAAWALNPGADTRKELLGGACAGGPNNGLSCGADSECEPGGSCELPDLSSADPIRGWATLIADKDAQAWNDTSTIALETSSCSSGDPIPEDDTRSTFTILFEFQLNGKSYTFADTFRDMGTLCDCSNMCVPTWNQPAVESRIADQIAILWGKFPAAAGTAIADVLGAPGTTPFIESIAEVPICTDAAACNDTVFSDHSAATDSLASVRRFKVNIFTVN